MKRRLPLTALLASAAAIFAFPGGIAFGALNVYEGFGVGSTSAAPYSTPASSAGSLSANVGSLLNGRPTVTVAGLSGAWIEDQLPLNVRFFRYHLQWALNYPGLLSNNTAGALMYGSDFAYPEINDVNRASRLLASPFTSTSTGTHYISFLMRKNHISGSYIGFEMLSGASTTNTTRVLQVGGSTDTSGETGNWGMRVNNTAHKGAAPVGQAAQTTVPVVEDETVLVVLKLSLSATDLSDSITMWVNPASLSAEAMAGDGVTLSGINFAADRIAMANYTFAGHWCYFDEFRLGTAWTDVLPGPSVEAAAPVGVANQAAFGALNQEFKYKLFASNRPSSFVVSGALPAGLVLNSATGIISGLPTATGVANLSFTATNPAGTSAAVNFSIEIVQALNTRDLLLNAVTATGDSAIQSSEPVLTQTASLARDGSFTSFHSSDAYYNNRVVIDLGAGNEKKLTGFRFYPRPAYESRAFAGQVQTSMDGINFTKIGEVDFSPVPGQWNTVPITSTALGRYFRYYHPGRTDVAEIEFRAFGDTPIPPVITPAQTFTATTGENFSITLAATNLPTSWTEVSSGSGNNRLPTGLTLNTETGVISGLTNELGVFTPSFTATNADGTATAEVLTLTVIAPALIAYEGFDYTESALAYEPEVGSGNYVSVNGGTGWVNPWQIWSQEPLVEPGLSKGNLVVTGKKVAPSTNGNTRSFTAQPNTGTYWFNFLINTQDDTPPVDIAWRLNVVNSSDENDGLLSAGYSFQKYRIGGSNVPNLDLPILADGSTHMITIRLDMFSRLMHVWLNVEPGATPPSEATAVSPSGTAFSPFVFDGVRFNNFGRFEGKFIDEIRVGKTFAQVAPSIVVASGLDDFRSATGLPADGSQDLATPAGDGVANLLKYAFNMIGGGIGQATTLSIPNTSVLNATTGIAGLPSAAIDGSGRLTLTYIRTKAAVNSGIVSTVEYSSTLAADSWAINASATEVVTSIDANYERVTVTDSVTANPRRFVRVRVMIEAP